MNNNLAIIALGHRNSGKSETWKVMFNDPNVRSRQVNERTMTFSNGEKVKVFLRNGSPQERNERLEDVVPKSLPNPHILLCSIQYALQGSVQQFVEDAIGSFNWLEENDYDIYIHWLNPGYHDSQKYNDYLNMIPFILDKTSMLGTRDGTVNAKDRVREMMDFIYGWAKSRNLIFK